MITECKGKPRDPSNRLRRTELIDKGSQVLASVIKEACVNPPFETVACSIMSAHLWKAIESQPCSHAGGALPVMDDTTLRRARKGYQQALSAQMAAAAAQGLTDPTAALVACYALLESLQDAQQTSPGPSGPCSGLDAAVAIYTNTLTALPMEVKTLPRHHWPVPATAMQSWEHGGTH